MKACEHFLHWAVAGVECITKLFLFFCPGLWSQKCIISLMLGIMFPGFVFESSTRVDDLNLLYIVGDCMCELRCSVSVEACYVNLKDKL